MKKTLTLLFAVAAFTASFAQGRSNNNKHNNGNSNGTYNNNGQYDNNQNNNYQNSALVVNAYSQNGFTVTLDNGNTSQSNSNNVRLRSISSGNHLVTVSEFRSSILGKQVPRVIYNSNVTFRSGYETVLTIDNNGTATITERQISGNGNGNNGNNWNNGKGKKNKKNKYPHDNRNHDKQKNHGNDDDDRKDD